MRAIVQIADQDLSLERFRLFLHFPTFERNFGIESIIVVRLFRETSSHLLSFGEIINFNCFFVKF
jgi:hypothetical protein